MPEVEAARNQDVIPTEAAGRQAEREKERLEAIQTVQRKGIPLIRR